MNLKSKKLSKAELEEKIKSDPDFVFSKKHANSLDEFLKHNEKTVHDYQISKLLKIKKYEVNKMYKNTLKKLKTLLGTDFLDKE